MIERKTDIPAEPASKKRFNAAETPRPVMSFRVNADLHSRMKASVEKNGYALTEEIERRLIRSFDLEDRVAELERYTDVLEQTESLLWSNDSDRALGHSFALALMAARHASGLNWRDDPAAPIILAGVVRRLMDRCSRDAGGGSMVAGLFDKARLAATSDSIAQTLGDYIDKAMPSLPPLQPQDDFANWTNRAHTAMTFRDKATGKLLQLVTGPEYDLADPEAVRDLGPGYLAAIDRFRPIKDTINTETFIVFALKDGSSAWESLDRQGRKIHVPAGQDAPAPDRDAPLSTSPPARSRLEPAAPPASGSRPRPARRRAAKRQSPGIE